MLEMKFKKARNAEQEQREMYKFVKKNRRKTQ